MRNTDRHRHIGIKLRYQSGDKWETLEALDWSKVGFNFFSDKEIAGPQLHLKRGLIHLEGTIVWRAPANNDDVLRGFLVNELLYQAARSTSGNPQLHQRLVNLIRAQGLVSEKRQALRVLGVGISDAKLEEMLLKRKQEHALVRYGVRVVSDEWTRLIENAVSVSSVVESLEKWSNSLGG